MAKINYQSPKVLKGVLNQLSKSNDILTFQKNGVIKIKNSGIAIKRPNQYKK